MGKSISFCGQDALLCKEKRCFFMDGVVCFVINHFVGLSTSSSCRV